MRLLRPIICKTCYERERNEFQRAMTWRGKNVDRGNFSGITPGIPGGKIGSYDRVYHRFAGGSGTKRHTKRSYIASCCGWSRGIICILQVSAERRHGAF